MRNPHNPLGGALCHETWWEKDRMLYGNTARGLTVNVNSGFLVGFFFFFPHNTIACTSVFKSTVFEVVEAAFLRSSLAFPWEGK